MITNILRVCQGAQAMEVHLHSDLAFVLKKANRAIIPLVECLVNSLWVDLQRYMLSTEGAPIPISSFSDSEVLAVGFDKLGDIVAWMANLNQGAEWIGELEKVDRVLDLDTITDNDLELVSVFSLESPPDWQSLRLCL